MLIKIAVIASSDHNLVLDIICIYFIDNFKSFSGTGLKHVVTEEMLHTEIVGLNKISSKHAYEDLYESEFKKA
jgi:hypothetical protein